MKNKIMLLLLVFLTLIGLGCNTPTHTMHIEGKDKIIINQSEQLKVIYQGEELPLENLEWTLSDYEIASIENGVFYARDYGVVVVGVVDKTNTLNYCSKTIEIVPPYVEDIVVSGPTQLYIDKTATLEAKVVPSIIESPIVWESSNTDIIIVDEGEILAVGVGVCDIIIKCDDFVKKYQIEVLPTPTSITVSGKNNIGINEVTYLSFNIDESVTLSTTNTDIITIVDNAIVGVKEGTAVITAVKDSDNSVQGTFEIHVKKTKTADIEMTAVEKAKIDELINNMTLEQLVGEMFNVGFKIINSGWGEPVQIETETGLPYAQFSREEQPRSMIDYLSNYKFANFTIHNDIGKTRNNLLQAVKTLKEFSMSNTGVEPFITINSTGGFIMEATTSLPTNIALSNAKASTINTVNELYAKELRALGINSIINGYVCNNEDINSSLNTYGTDITKAIAVSTIASQGLSENGVIMIPELSGDYYYSDTRSLEDIKATDWKLIESAIKNGSQIISLPSSIYVEEQDNYYGLLSAEYLKAYIRDELNYDGIIMMGNDALGNLIYDENLYTYVTLAVNMGVDMFGFDINVTTSRWSDTKEQTELFLSVYDHIISATQNGEISIDRIKESVARILLVKLRNNIVGDETNYSDFNFAKNSSLITNHAPEFITYLGKQFIIDKDDEVLIISESYEQTGTQYSLGDNVRKFFEVRGYKNIDIYHTDTLTPDVIIQNAKKYDVIFVGVSTVSSSTKIGFGANRTEFIGFMNELIDANPNVCVIATGMPSALNKLPKVENAILLYSYYEANFESLCKVLNNEVK